MQTYEQAVKKIVDFWIDKSFKTSMNQNNGDNSQNGGLTFMLMNDLSTRAQNEITEDKIKKFESKLTELLFSIEHENEWQRDLDVDYHPCKFLSEAAKFAGIDAKCFPCKTWSRIRNDNTAIASYQYGGKQEVL